MIVYHGLAGLFGPRRGDLSAPSPPPLNKNENNVLGLTSNGSKKWPDTFHEDLKTSLNIETSKEKSHRSLMKHIGLASLPLVCRVP